MSEYLIEAKNDVLPFICMQTQLTRLNNPTLYHT